MNKLMSMLIVVYISVPNLYANSLAKPKKSLRTTTKNKYIEDCSLKMSRALKDTLSLGKSHNNLQSNLIDIIEDEIQGAGLLKSQQENELVELSQELDLLHNLTCQLNEQQKKVATYLNSAKK